MLFWYYEPIITIPIRSHGESYAKYDQRLMDFFYEYMKNYSVKYAVFRNFWSVLKDDFSKNIGYEYFIKLLYRSNIDWSFFKYKGYDYKRIIKKLPRKEMLLYEECTFPFMRLTPSGTKKYKEMVLPRFSSKDEHIE